MDDTVTYYPSNQRSERFSLESFKFIGEHTFVFVHCHVRICNISDPNSKCVRNCEDRRKRDVTQVAESLDDVYPLAQGPFTLEKGEEEVGRQRTRSSVKSPAAEGSFGFFLDETIFTKTNPPGVLVSCLAL